MKITRRSLLGGLAIAGVSAGAGAGTFAYLQDSEGTDMTINVGSLSISNDPVEFQLAEDPNTEGEDYFVQTITIKNDGTLPVRQVLLKSISADDETLANALLITDLKYGRQQDRGDRASILSEILPSDHTVTLPDGSDATGNYLQELINYLNDNDVRLEDIISDPSEDGEVLHVGDEAYLDIVARWDYSKIPSQEVGGGENSTETPETVYNGGSLTGTITIDGKQEEE